MLTESYQILDQLRLPHGLYIASPSKDYQYVWIRDCVYMSLPYLNKPNRRYESTYYRLLDLFRTYEWKLHILSKQKPSYEWEYLHARYSALDVLEIHDQNWGHVQHDMIGAFLFGIGSGLAAGKRMFRDDKDLEIVQRLVEYLGHIEYWHDPDNGMWEESREVHASSIGACVAGLKAVEPYVLVPGALVDKGLHTLLILFPRESQEKSTDLAQLSLVYPYQLFTGMLGDIIVQRAEQQLLRERGLIRYEGDSYYSTLEPHHGRHQPRDFYRGTEAEWTFGLPWLALCHLSLGRHEEASTYIHRTESLMTKPGVLPELYYGGTAAANPNTPLGWSSAMYILAKEALLSESNPRSNLA